MILIVSVLLIAASRAHGHSYHLGECPEVKPMENFNIDRFLGKWFVIQKTATGSSCLINNYTRDAVNPDHYKIEQVSNNILGLVNSDRKYHYTGDLIIPDASNAASMKVQFPMNIAGDASYVVFITDYYTYAGIFTCQKLAFANRQSATIISRTKTLDKEIIDMIRDKLSSFGVDPYHLSIINQENCAEGSITTTNTNEGDKTFNSEGFPAMIHRAGEKLGDGIEIVSDTAKKVYSRVMGNLDETREEINVEKNAKEDAEWLP